MNDYENIRMNVHKISNERMYENTNELRTNTNTITKVSTGKLKIYERIRRKVNTNMIE